MASDIPQKQILSRRGFIGAAAAVPAAASIPATSSGAGIAAFAKTLPLPPSAAALFASGKAIPAMIAKGFNPNAVIGYLLEGYEPIEIAETLSRRIDALQALRSSPESYITKDNGSAIEKLQWALHNRCNGSQAGLSLTDFLNPNRHLAQLLSNCSASDQPDKLEKLLDLSADDGYFAEAKRALALFKSPISVNSAIERIEQEEIRILTPFLRAEYAKDPHAFLEKFADQFKCWDKESFFPTLQRILSDTALPQAGTHNQTTTDDFETTFETVWSKAKESLKGIPALDAHYIPSLSNPSEACYALFPAQTTHTYDYRMRYKTNTDLAGAEWLDNNIVRVKTNSLPHKTLLHLARNKSTPSHAVHSTQHEGLLQAQLISGTLGFGS